MTEFLNVPDAQQSEEALRAADAALVSGWRHEDGRPLSDNERIQAAGRFAELRQEFREKHGTENSETIQQAQGEQ